MPPAAIGYDLDFFSLRRGDLKGSGQSCNAARIASTDGDHVFAILHVLANLELARLCPVVTLADQLPVDPGLIVIVARHTEHGSLPAPLQLKGLPEIDHFRVGALTQLAPDPGRAHTLHLFLTGIPGSLLASRVGIPDQQTSRVSLPAGNVICAGAFLPLLGRGHDRHPKEHGEEQEAVFHDNPLRATSL